MQFRRFLSLNLLLVLLTIGAGFPIKSDAQEGQPCQLSIGNSCPDPLYICKKDSKSSGGQSTKGRCACRWGDLEVGLFNFKPGSICALISKYNTDKAQNVFGEVLSEAINSVMALAIMAALVSIVIGGYIYMTAGGSADRVRTAKIWIGSALAGVSLAVLAWLILNLISPNLV